MSVVRRSAVGRLRCDIDDPTPLPLTHPWQARSTAAKHSAQIEIQRPLPDFVGHLDNGGAGHLRCIVDDNIDLPELLDRALYEAFWRGGISKIGMKGFSLRIHPSNLFHDFIGSSGIASIMNDHG